MEERDCVVRVLVARREVVVWRWRVRRWDRRERIWVWVSECGCDSGCGGVERRERSWDWVVLLASWREIRCGEVRRVEGSRVDMLDGGGEVVVVVVVCLAGRLVVVDREGLGSENKIFFASLTGILVLLTYKLP